MKCCHPVLCVVISTSAAWAASPPDVNALVRQSITNFERSRREGLSWRYVQSDATSSSSGKVVEVSEVTPLLGTPYERLIENNGEPLSPAERKTEDAKFQKALRRRENESPEERAARIRKYEGDWSFLKDLPNAYFYKLHGEESVNGRPAWIVDMTPRPDFRPSTPRGAMLKHIEGRLWIDQRDVQWAKAEAHVTDTIAIGWILARVGAGAEIRLALERVAEGVWLPREVDIDGTARVLLIHRKDLKERISFSQYARVEGGPAMHVTGTRFPSKTATEGSFR